MTSSSPNYFPKTCLLIPLHVRISTCGFRRGHNLTVYNTLKAETLSLVTVFVFLEGTALFHTFKKKIMYIKQTLKFE